MSYNPQNNILTVSAGTTSGSLTSMVLSNSNNVSFGLNGSVVTASASQTNAAFSASGSSSTFQTLQFGNSNGVSFSISNGSIVGTVATNYQSSNANYLTSQSNQAISAGNGSSTFQTISFADSNGVSFSTGTQGIYATVKTDYQSSNVNYLTSQSVQAFSASGGSSAFQTLNFANSNGFTFSNANGSVIGSYTVPAAGVTQASLYATGNTTQSSNGNQAISSLVFQGAGAASVGISNGSIVISAPNPSAGNVTVSAGTASAGLASVVFSNSNGVGFGLNGSTITASYTVPVQSVQPYNIFAAGTQTANTSGSVVLSNSNGISFGMSNNSVITASYTVPTQTTQPYNIIAAGTQTANTSGSVAFVNSNGITFGMSNSSAITASYTVPAATVFSNSNNVSFGLAGSTITATATISQSNQNISLYALGNTTQNSSSQLNVSNLSFNGLGGMTVGYSNGSIQLSAPQTVAQTNQAFSASGSSSTFQTIQFGNSNGVSFSISNGSIVGTVATNYQSSNANYLTTQSNQAFSASGSSSTFQTIQFGNSNGVSFSISNGSVVGTVATNYQSSNANYLTSQSNQAISGSNASSTFQTISFGSSNGINFYLTNGSVVGSYTVPTQTTQPYNVIAAGTQTANTSGSVVFNNANGISFGMSNSSVITASYTVPAATVFSNSNNVSFGLAGSTVTATATFAQSVQPGIQSIQVSNTTYTTGNVIFSNANGISFGSSAGGAITASYTVPAAGLTTASIYATGNTVSSSNGSIALSSLIFAGSGIASVGVSAGSVIISAQPAFSASGASSTFKTLSFGNANGFTFSNSGGSVVGSYTVPAAGLTAASIYATGNTTLSSTGTQALSSLIFSGAGNASVGVSGGSVVVSSPIPAFLASGVSSTFQTLQFANANGFTFSNSGGSIVGSYGSASSLSATGILSLSQNSNTLFIGASTVTFNSYDPNYAFEPSPAIIGNGSLHMQPMTAPNVSFDKIIIPVFFTANTASASVIVRLTAQIGIFTRSSPSASTLARASSISTSYAFTASSNVNSSFYHGYRHFTFASSGFLSGGEYWLGFLSSSASSSQNGSLSNMVGSYYSQAFSGVLGVASNSTNQYYKWLGYYSAGGTGSTTSAIPGTIALSEIVGSAAAYMSRPLVIFDNSTPIP